MNKLVPFLKLLAIIFVLLILLLFIYCVTYQKHIVNEIKYKEQFRAYKMDPSLKNPILPALNPNMVNTTLSEANRQRGISHRIMRASASNLNSWNVFDSKRKTQQNAIIERVNATKDGMKKYAGNLSLMNQKLYNMRNGDKFAEEDKDKVGTYDATLFL
jgi:hypothetical protein